VSVVVKGRTREIDRLDDVVATAELPLSPWHAVAQGPVRPRPAGRGDRPAVPGRDPAAWETPLSGTRRTAHE
jgi:hypothetical protein